MNNISYSKICPILSAKIMSQSQEELPVIIQLAHNDSTLINGIKNLSTKVKTNLPIINGIACDLTTDIIYKLSTNPEIEYISFDSKVYTQLDIAMPTIEGHFPNKIGYKGNGVTIAVIDTGVAPHLDLTVPNNRIIGFVDFINNKLSPYDDNGHGTHVTGIIAGNGYASNGKYTGVAPEANILAIKALDSEGSGNTSTLVKAISHVVETKDKYNTKIINLSIGTPANNSYRNDPLCKAVEKAVQAGLVVVVAAGNNGPGEKTILSPGISKYAITVGAADDKRTINTEDDTVASFSSRGPTIEGLLKPDLVAPGVNINSLSNVELDGYRSSSGTSMATPLVAGSIALLLNKYKNLKPEEIKDKLLRSCIDLRDSRETQGAGMLNLKLLFDEDDNTSTNTPSIYIDFKKDKLLENIIILLILLFLFDSPKH